MKTLLDDDRSAIYFSLGEASGKSAAGGGRRYHPFSATANIMKRSGFRSLDALAGALFVALGIAGVLFFGWRELRLAFLLLIYFLVIIGFRLDEISRQLASIDRRLAAQLQRQVKLGAATAPKDEPPFSASGRLP